TVLSEQELYVAAKEHRAPYELVRMVAKSGKLPVPNFSAGGIATPADAALMMQLGAEAIFVGSGIFMKERATPLDVENNPVEREEAVSRAKAIVVATTHYNDPKILAEVAEQVTGTMKGLAAAAIEDAQLLPTRGCEGLLGPEKKSRAGEASPPAPLSSCCFHNPKEAH